MFHTCSRRVGSANRTRCALVIPACNLEILSLRDIMTWQLFCAAAFFLGFILCIGVWCIGLLEEDTDEYAQHERLSAALGCLYISIIIFQPLLGVVALIIYLLVGYIVKVKRVLRDRYAKGIRHFK